LKKSWIYRDTPREPKQEFPKGTTTIKDSIKIDLPNKTNFLPSEVAEILRYDHVDSVYRIIREGKLKATKPSGTLLIPRRELYDFLVSGYSPGQPDS